MGLIQLEGMEFYAYHGHFEEERIVGNAFVVDVTVETNLKPAAYSDQIEDALDYQLIYQIVKEQMAINSALLENIAKRILDGIHNKFDKQIHFSKIKISKMNPPMSGKLQKVSITMERNGK